MAQHWRIAVLLFAYVLPLSCEFQLPEVQQIPTGDHPFVFHHVRKAGGTSLRQVLYNSSLEAGIQPKQIFIPCTGGIHCWNWCLHANHSYSVVGGHFSVAEVYKATLPPTRKPTEAGPAPPAPTAARNFSCLVNLRHPVERTVSCLFYRFTHLNELHKQGKFTAQVLEQYLRRPNSYGFGCGNEAVRMLSGYSVEDELIALAEQPQDFRDFLVRQSIRHMRRCVVYLQDAPQASDNAAVMRHFLPWVRLDPDDSGGDGLPAANVRKHKSAIEDEQLLAIIERFNEPEMRVYEAGVEQFKAQLQHALAHSHAAHSGAAVLH